MAKMTATAKMPRGVLRRYPTRMMTAEGTTFEERSPKWSRFYAQHGWAVPAAAEEPAAPAARRRGRPPGSKNKVVAPDPAKSEPAKSEPVDAMSTRSSALVGAERGSGLMGKTVAELRQMAEEKGVALPEGYVRHDELVKAIEKADKPADKTPDKSAE